MKQRIILIISTLLIVSYISYQRSRSIHFAYQYSLLEREEKLLEERLKTLRMDIRSMATPDELYSYWQSSCPHLNFPAYAISERNKEGKVVYASYRQ
ncbi:MAG: hypothetical protein HQL32_01850 [Planctomycetes bacterium]|nr:hypothetical protein [Planctomycetota bacterium]